MKKVSILLFVCMFAQALVNAQTVNLELNKEYSVQGFKFTVQAAKILKDAYPVGMFSLRPSNPNMNSSYDGVLGLEITLTAGDKDAFSKLEKYLIHEKGDKNVKEDMSEMSNAPKFTVLFNVPLSAKKLVFGIGSLKLNLENVLSK